jgi:hypothetical protein
MATPSTVTEIANISQYLWSAKLAKDAAFGNGNSNINSGRDLVLFVENAALEYGIAQSLDGIQGVANDVYRLCGAKLQEANEILQSGSSGGIVVNRSTGVSALVFYEDDFTIGNVGAPLLEGQTSFTINIGSGRTFSTASMILTLDQSVLPKSDPNRLSYTPIYDSVTGLITITFNQAVVNSQLYTVQFSYLIV